MPEKNITDSIQKILDKNKGFMTVTKLASHLTADEKNSLGLRDNDSVKKIRRKLEQHSDNRFMFLTKGRSVYILIPCEPSELVMSFLSPDKPLDTRIIRSLPFNKQEFTAIVNELIDEGRVKIKLAGCLVPKVFRAVNADVKPVLLNADDSGNEYTDNFSREQFREAFDALDDGRIFVRIPDLRRKLDWPRETFDKVLRDLRNDETIGIYLADESTMTKDEINDCFVDENNFRMGTVTWNVR